MTTGSKVGVRVAPRPLGRVHVRARTVPRPLGDELLYAASMTLGALVGAILGLISIGWFG